MKLVALFRGINVGGHHSVPMADLRAMFESLGYDCVRSYVQSGNVVFESAARSTGREGVGRIVHDLESSFERTFGFSSSVILLTATELAKVVAENPWGPAEGASAGDVYVTFLRERPAKPPDDADMHRHAGATTDELASADRHVYVRCHGGYGRTKLSNAFFEKELGVSATTRNWRTVSKLAEMAHQRGHSG